MGIDKPSMSDSSNQPIGQASSRTSMIMMEGTEITPIRQSIRDEWMDWLDMMNCAKHALDSHFGRHPMNAPFC